MRHNLQALIKEYPHLFLIRFVVSAQQLTSTFLDCWKLRLKFIHQSAMTHFYKHPPTGGRPLTSEDRSRIGF